ncbi:tRNA (adenosine(37)-N6)-threonylcarbamoyltransferase complex transferase subunit TsaD [Candidatus Daviesbacteria bacterium RIFCSPLOWO2_02_FULL_40_8]|uniref:tRNA N6-adenosine threonylcarbamoyltransferase n=1 Tax=Candidatus Daviesbacteria bacterium RIFCSPLOWO2_01_FULL_40_24 TaxID=1797787 RepID=A0A1F5MKJ2_9BACT|nr:MAG: tRNA (adenosine(37)-N6)-threonylcarbamoyltransferase complex transferase subunit TsaD [Candidatus Daviesbacteria bacterium RIFCSPHIGHO2_01_FULL_41_45]OGE65829.1 MAG: tRNA (adenosine(37)-N6)-threonylcarbamoyltransferase complex transferase subunit TsaD [Candidatus Daviesbacteria bacterium RIFCSPLOWO2_01_FULL_40_24]OGE66911.1 MAG: tRNA (adenosine(37)-N6)-threonylcarbamoyltransferase complex transferase subunit TsaD [Candidatus Daviesbacteria bacterium RIFCSPLOWO2_02_FULL_40_8]
MTILGIETSCDETAAAIVSNDNKRIQILSNIISSSQDLHIKYGGILPETAAREQQKMIIPVIQEALLQSKCNPEDIDAIAVTAGPGLIGSLLVGVETAKTLSLLWRKPLIPVNHLLAHFYANWVLDTPTFPVIGLLVSGGHTDIILMKDHDNYDYLGGTRDDAAGECFDKCARLLGLPSGGPNLARLAQKGNPQAFNLPRPMWNSKDYDFSFSGLKTAVANIITHIDELQKPDLAASIEQAIIDVLIKKTTTAALDNNIEHVMLAGGVASNQRLRESVTRSFIGRVFTPEPLLCTDNAVTTATYALFHNHPVDPLILQANPNLSLA